MSKRLLLVSAFAFLGATVPANADWSGLYIGGHVGGIWGDVDTTNVVDGYTFWPLSPGESVDISADGVLGGAQLGYNFTHSRWLFGVELTGAGMDFDETVFLAPDDVYGVEVEWLATAAARVGFILPSGSSVIYVKGGYAGSDVQTSETDTGGATGSFTTDETHHGWMAGAGLEHMISSDVSVGVEYNYIDLGSQDHSVVPIAGGVLGATAIVNDIDAQLHTVTARLNWHFWP